MNIEKIKNDIVDFKITNNISLENFRLKFLSKKGIIPSLFSELRNVPKEQKKDAGQKINDLKNLATEIFQKGKLNFSNSEEKSIIDDYTKPSNILKLGSRHPISIVKNKIIDIFLKIGFDISEGPEIEDDWHNFTALNLPEYHPARDMQDTFFINPNAVLRTHTSNVQIHLMENQDPPLRHICCGRVFRNEAVSYKSFCLFNQVEGLVINETSSFAEMKGTLEYFVQEMFGKDTKMRFRPSYFPFTEPSAEVDIWNSKLNQWMEILGCGMVNPNVLSNVGYDNEKYQGFAFGMGIERIAMIKYGIKDIRLFYQNDKRFLEQF